MAEKLTIARIKKVLIDRKTGEILNDTQVTNLQIRVTGVGVRWSMRCRIHGHQHRYDLGPVCDGKEDNPPALCLETARARGLTLREHVRRGNNPARQIEAWATGRQFRDIPEPPPPPPPPPAEPVIPSWLWEDAVANFIDWNVTYRRQDTADDYEQKLAQVPEMHRFRGRQVNEITRNELMEAVGAIAARGVYPTAAGVRRTLSRFFNWLAEADRQNQTNVQSHVMLGTKVPEAPRAEIGQNEADFDPDDEAGSVPSEISLGRALVIARSGVLPERTGLGIQLLLGTVQRRRAVIGATWQRFKDAGEHEQAWYVPPYFRKSGSKRGSKSHLVPIVSWVDPVVRQLIRMCVADNPFLLPGLKPRDKEIPQHGDIEMLNKALQFMPGVDISPHGARYAFASYGERDLGFAKSEGKVVLDHLEGTDSKDVTGVFYSSDPAVKRKREMLIAWCSWLDHWAAKAIEANPLLLDHEFLRRAMFRKRYGYKRFKRRIAYRKSRGWPLWGPGAGEQQAAAE